VNVGRDPHDQILVDTRRERVFVPVYSQTGNGHVSVLDARTGRPLYTIAAGKAPVWIAMDARTGRAFVIDGSSTGLRVLDTRNGHLLRTVLAGLHPSILMVDEQTGRAFVPTNAGLSVLDTRSEVVLRNVVVGQGQSASLPRLDVRSGRVFVDVMSLAQGPGPGSIIVLDARSGAVVRRVAVGDDPGPVVVDERVGRVVVLTGGLPGTINSVSILDAWTGAILRTLPVGVAANGMAVDERNGRVVVINGPSSVILPDPWAWLPVWLRRRVPFLPPPGRHSHIVLGAVSEIDPTR
jgi:DNA-binding beta-propeller fold protein YncE